jgi:hypothetical protein
MMRPSHHPCPYNLKALQRTPEWTKAIEVQTPEVIQNDHVVIECPGPVLEPPLNSLHQGPAAAFSREEHSYAK